MKYGLGKYIIFHITILKRKMKLYSWPIVILVYYIVQCCCHMLTKTACGTFHCGVKSDLLAQFYANNLEICRSNCLEDESCAVATFYPDEKSCYLFRYCQTYDVCKVEECISCKVVDGKELLSLRIHVSISSIIGSRSKREAATKKAGDLVVVDYLDSIPSKNGGKLDVTSLENRLDKALNRTMKNKKPSNFKGFRSGTPPKSQINSVVRRELPKAPLSSKGKSTLRKIIKKVTRRTYVLPPIMGQLLNLGQLGQASQGVTPMVLSASQPQNMQTPIATTPTPLPAVELLAAHSTQSPEAVSLPKMTSTVMTSLTSSQQTPDSKTSISSYETSPDISTDSDKNYSYESDERDYDNNTDIRAERVVVGRDDRKCTVNQSCLGCFEGFVKGLSRSECVRRCNGNCRYVTYVKSGSECHLLNSCHEMLPCFECLSVDKACLNSDSEVFKVSAKKSTQNCRRLSDVHHNENQESQKLKVSKTLRKGSRRSKQSQYEYVKLKGDIFCVHQKYVMVENHRAFVKKTREGKEYVRVKGKRHFLHTASMSETKPKGPCCGSEWKLHLVDASKNNDTSELRGFRGENILTAQQESTADENTEVLLASGQKQPQSKEDEAVSNELKLPNVRIESYSTKSPFATTEPLTFSHTARDDEQTTQTLTISDGVTRLGDFERERENQIIIGDQPTNGETKNLKESKELLNIISPTERNVLQASKKEFYVNEQNFGIAESKRNEEPQRNIDSITNPPISETRTDSLKDESSPNEEPVITESPPNKQHDEFEVSTQPHFKMGFEDTAMKKAENAIYPDEKAIENDSTTEQRMSQRLNTEANEFTIKPREGENFGDSAIESNFPTQTTKFRGNEVSSSVENETPNVPINVQKEETEDEEFEDLDDRQSKSDISFLSPFPHSIENQQLVVQVTTSESAQLAEIRESEQVNTSLEKPTSFRMSPKTTLSQTRQIGMEIDNEMEKPILILNEDTGQRGKLAHGERLYIGDTKNDASLEIHTNLKKLETPSAECNNEKGQKKALRTETLEKMPLRAGRWSQKSVKSKKKALHKRRHQRLHAPIDKFNDDSVSESEEADESVAQPPTFNQISKPSQIKRKNEPETGRFKGMKIDGEWTSYQPKMALRSANSKGIQDKADDGQSGPNLSALRNDEQKLRGAKFPGQFRSEPKRSSNERRVFELTEEPINIAPFRYKAHSPRGKSVKKVPFSGHFPRLFSAEEIDRSSEMPAKGELVKSDEQASRYDF